MTWLFCCFVFIVLTQCAFFSSALKKTDIPAGKGFESAIKAQFKSGARQRCDPNFRFHIPYTVNKTFKEDHFSAIRKSLDHFMSLTCLTFEWVNGPDDLPKRFDNGTGMYFDPSSYDYPYPAILSWNAKDILISNIRLCETLQFDNAFARANQGIYYALGFFPEHKRKDRDSYVSIFMDNVSPAWVPEFEVKEAASTHFPYDYKSVANFYPSDAAKDPSRLVMKSLTETPVTKNVELSPGDAFKINEKYCRKC